MHHTVAHCFSLWVDELHVLSHLDNLEILMLAARLYQCYPNMAWEVRIYPVWFSAEGA